MATVEKSIAGARGDHKIDVYVEGDYMGISFAWSSNANIGKRTFPRRRSPR
jgi:hypothetical protein